MSQAEKCGNSLRAGGGLAWSHSRTVGKGTWAGSQGAGQCGRRAESQALQCPTKHLHSGSLTQMLPKLTVEEAPSQVSDEDTEGQPG